MAPVITSSSPGKSRTVSKELDGEGPEPLTWANAGEINKAQMQRQVVSKLVNESGDTRSAWFIFQLQRYIGVFELEKKVRYSQLIENFQSSSVAGLILPNIILSQNSSQVTNFSRRKKQGNTKTPDSLSLIHIWRCRRSTLCRSRWSPYH